MIIIRASSFAGGARHRRQRPVSQERFADLHADTLDRERGQLHRAGQLLRPDHDDRMIRLTAPDRHELDGYSARPSSRPRGGLVIAQEMYGVNAYLRSVCDFYAGTAMPRWRPHSTIAAARPHLRLQQARPRPRPANLHRLESRPRAGRSHAARDAIADAGRIGIIGFCWGGSLAWLSPLAEAITPAPSLTMAR